MNKRPSDSSIIAIKKSSTKVNNRELFITHLQNVVRNLIMIGNPGVGKSTLLNCLIGEVKFKSGEALEGVTEVLQTLNFCGINFVDTPGLDDILRRQRAALEIEKALKLGGPTYLIFVTTLEGGRIRNCDIEMIKVVLNSMKSIESQLEYMVIINKDDTNAPIDEIVIRYKRVGLTPDMFLKVVSQEGLKGDNKLVDIPDLYHNISRLKPTIIRVKDVLPLVLDKWEEENKKISAELADAKLEIDRLREEAGRSIMIEKKFRVKIGNNPKVHSVNCQFVLNSLQPQIEVLNYSANDMCLKCFKID